MKPRVGVVEFFDSLGTSPNDLEYLKCFGKTVHYNETRVQGLTSTNCGLFCLYVAFMRLVDIDLPYKEVMSDLFSKDFEKNDRLVMRFFETYN